MHNNQKSALVVEGGALRSIFSAGLLDGFLEQAFDPFDFYIGVSAGAFNLISYLSKAHGKSLELYKEVISSRDIISFIRFIKGGHLIDLDMIEELVFQNITLELSKIFQLNKPLYVCLTEVDTGNAIYVRTNEHNIRPTLKASASLPLFYRDFPRLENRLMSDGGMADGIPVIEAIRQGATNIMVIRSRHKEYMKKDTIIHRYIRWKLRNYPQLVATMEKRVEIFRETIAVINNPPKYVNIIEVCPPLDFNMGRFNTHYDNLMTGYKEGHRLSKSIIEQWNFKTSSAYKILHDHSSN